MKDKKELLYRNCIITCWVMLIVCVLLKLFGIPWFDINTQTPILQSLDAFIENNTILSYLYNYFLIWSNGILVILCTVKNISKKSFIMYSLYMCASIRFNVSIAFVLDTIFLLFVCLRENRSKHTVFNYITVVVLNLIYQSISLYTKNLGIKLELYGTVESKLFMIDYYIMLIMTWLYLKKGGGDICSIFHFRLGEVIAHHCGSYRQKTLCKKHTQNLKQHSIVNREV